MSKYIPGNQKHLTLEDRVFIENSLNQNHTFKDIAKYLCKDPTTISKEVKTRRSSERLIYKGGQTTTPNTLTANGSFATV